MGFGAAAPQIVILRITVPAAAERQGQEPEGVNDV